MHTNRYSTGSGTSSSPRVFPTMLPFALTSALWLALAAPLWAEERTAPGPAEGAARPAPGTPVFEKDVLPILQAKCTQCHGAKVQKSELNLSTPAGVKRGSASGPIVVSGKPDDSLLLEIVREALMPPPKKGVPLA